MIREREIRERLAALGAREISIDDFEDWLDAESWNMHADSDEGAIALASAALLLLSEHGLGYRDHADVRSGLLNLLDEIFVQVSILPDLRAQISRDRSGFGVSRSLVVPVEQAVSLVA